MKHKLTIWLIGIIAFLICAVISYMIILHFIPQVLTFDSFFDFVLKNEESKVAKNEQNTDLHDFGAPMLNTKVASIDSNSATTLKTNGTVSGTVQGISELCVSVSAGHVALPLDPRGPAAIPNYESRACNGAGYEYKNTTLLSFHDDVWKLSVREGTIDKNSILTIGVYQPTKYKDGRVNWNGGKLIACAIISHETERLDSCQTLERPKVNKGTVAGVVVGKETGYILVSFNSDRGDPPVKVVVTDSTIIRRGDSPATLANIQGQSGGGVLLYVTGPMNSDGSITAEELVLPDVID